MSVKQLLVALPLAALPLAAWTGAGCASILGVDSSDYGDAAGILCTCARSADTCAAEVERRVADDVELEQTAIDCMEVDPDCKAVANCVRDAGYCAASGESCVGKLEDGALQTCCDGLTCQDDECCGDEASACVGDGECCSGRCVDGTCGPVECVAGGGPCERNRECCSRRCVANLCVLDADRSADE